MCIHDSRLIWCTSARCRIGAFTCHGIVLLLQCSGVDDASEEAAVADSVLFPLVALVQQLVVQEEQLAAQRVKLIHRSRAWGSHNNNVFNRTICLTHIHSCRNKLKYRVSEQAHFKKKQNKIKQKKRIEISVACE